MKTMPDRPVILHLLLYALVTVVTTTTLVTTSADLTSPHQLHSPAAAGGDRSRPNSRMISAVESRLLNMFGLPSRPRPSSNVPIPEYMLQLFRRQQKLNQDNGAIASTVRSFRHQESEQDVQHAVNEFHFRFNVSSMQDNELLQTAELRLFRGEGAAPSPRTKRDIAWAPPLQRILVYDVVRPPTASSEAILRLIDSRRVNVSTSGWEAFDVFPAVVRWQRQALDNHGIYVRVTRDNAPPTHELHEHVRLRRSADADERTWREQQPLLVTFSDDARAAGAAAGRWKRSGGRKGGKNSHDKGGGKSKDGNKGGEICRRHSLYVDFTDVGWNDWIVAPPGYQAYYCHGKCTFPLADHLNTTNHAVVQTLVSSVNPKSVPTACCVPTELSPISMLYLDQYDKVVLKNYQDMVVEGCGCR